MKRSVWRIVKAKHAADAFSGEGASLHGGRWNSPGRLVVYTAESRALAALEMLVHLNSQALLAVYVIGRAVIDDHWIQSVPTKSLPMNWRESPAPSELCDIGDQWIESNKSVALRVPSVVVEGEFNYLLNPMHADFAKIKFEPFTPFVFDTRLK